MPEINRTSYLNIAWLTLFCLSGSNNMACIKHQAVYTSHYPCHHTLCFIFKFIFRLRFKSKFDGAGVVLDNGSVIMVEKLDALADQRVTVKKLTK